MTQKIPRQSLEYLPVTIKKNRAVVISPTGIKLAAVPFGTVPVGPDYSDAVLIDGDLCLLLQPVSTAGPYDIWAEINDTDESVKRILGSVMRV